MRTTYLLRSAMLTALGFAPAGAFAQVVPQSGEPRTFRDIVEETAEKDPSYGGHGIAGLTGIQFVADADDKIASISLDLDVSEAFPGGSLATTTFSMKGSANLAKGGKPTSFGDLATGLTGGTTIEFGLTHYRSQFTPQNLDIGIRDIAVANCLIAYDSQRAILADQAERELEGAQERLDKFPTRATFCNPAKYQDGGAGAFVQKYNPDQAYAFTDSVLPGGVLMFGIKGKLSQTDFPYLDRTAFKTEDDSKFGYEGSLSLGWLFAGGRTSVIGSIGFGRTWRGQDEVTICQPITPPQSQCITAAGSAPVRQRTVIANVGWRHAFAPSHGGFAKFAIAPLVSLDIKNKAVAVDVPLYLIGDGKGGLRGGVRVTYTNERKNGGGRDDDVKFGVFVGVPFSLFS